MELSWEGMKQVEHVFQLHTGLVRQAAFGAQIRIRLHPPVTAKILFVDASHCRNSIFFFSEKNLCESLAVFWRTCLCWPTCNNMQQNAHF
ncbi:hypothetical protein EYR41_007957 [Orbilia oligospora]|uniref:Uncharacterized protein n=1 Tax=Orbilia oligospora TaxID=2813651 RepID=A0A8H2DWL3_ORBOL|nr:hypothetical protein EYR41_007957 [Orbilia oligospora]